ncbi:SDR family NAD(P)-dependent oxidoreductase [Streptomyces sp. NPDC049040]|uniref:SDR family NAD(P)-dependent oxidoreductase n=1 Tax=Streptomyces sp. NPDC049040 TaxID=3365593 RepID=UPI00371B6332
MSAMMLDDKVVVVYGAGGAIGGAVSRAFASEGARLFVTGRLREPVDAVAEEITAAGGSAEAATVDALDERAVEAHLGYVVGRAGRVDVSFNAVGVPDTGVVGVPLADLDVDRFSLPIARYTRSYFLTARLAARRMVQNGSGVIMTVSALPARTGTTLIGGYGPAQAAKDALTRGLSAELAPHGIRVLALRPHGIPETSSMREVAGLKAAGVDYERFRAYLAGTTHPRRVMTLGEVADAAVFLASDRARGLTGTVVNLTMGALDD